jgi:hypothetical protein
LTKKILVRNYKHNCPVFISWRSSGREAGEKQPLEAFEDACILAGTGGMKMRVTCTDVHVAALVYNTFKGKGKNGVKAKAATQDLDYDGLKHEADSGGTSGKCVGEGRGRHPDRAGEGRTAGSQGAVRGSHGMGPVSEGRSTHKVEHRRPKEHAGGQVHRSYQDTGTAVKGLLPLFTLLVSYSFHSQKAGAILIKRLP